MSRMIIAAAMPMPSLAPGTWNSTMSIGGPPSSTSKPGWLAACALLMTSLIAGLGTSCAALSNCTVANAMRPSGLI